MILKLIQHKDPLTLYNDLTKSLMSHDSKIFKQLHSQQVNVSEAFEKKQKPTTTTVTKCQDLKGIIHRFIGKMTHKLYR